MATRKKAKKRAKGAALILAGEEVERTLPKHGAMEGVFRAGSKARLHPAAVMMFEAAGIRADTGATVTVLAIIPPWQNQMAPVEAARVRFPDGAETTIETDMLLPAGGKNPRRKPKAKKNPDTKAILRRAMRGT
jgi:hypothetical protein